MSALSGLFGKAKAIDEAAKPAPVTNGFKIGGAPSGHGVAKPAEQQPGSVPTPVPVVETTPAAAKPSGLGGFKLSGSTREVPAEKSLPAEPASPVAVESDPLFDDLDLMAGAVAAPAPVRYPDETPASLPQRDLPADVSAEVARFVENLDHLHTLAPEPELASSAIRGIMMELKRFPQYVKHVSDDDVRVIVQMMRETMGLTKATKEKAVAKRTSKAKAVTQSVLDDLADLGL